LSVPASRLRRVERPSVPAFGNQAWDAECARGLPCPDWKTERVERESARGERRDERKRGRRRVSLERLEREAIEREREKIYFFEREREPIKLLKRSQSERGAPIERHGPK
jgi:hypothetical protein